MKFTKPQGFRAPNPSGLRVSFNLKFFEFGFGKLKIFLNLKNFIFVPSKFIKFRGIGNLSMKKSEIFAVCETEFHNRKKP
ncbi:hypothetical protein J2749_000670 [Methanobacterium oryzae]